jgi:hypothetical protein
VVLTVRGVDPTFKLSTTGRTTGDLEVGDRGFDQAFRLQGVPAMVRARLDFSTREALLELARYPLREGQLTVTEGQVRAVVPQGVSLERPVAEAIALAARVALRLAEPIDVVTELAKNARQDPASGVRVLCLKTLVRDCAEHASVVDALVREAAADADAAVRLEGAIALGPEGVTVLHALVADSSVEDDVGARAAETLGPRMDVEVVRATLRPENAASTRHRRPDTSCVCIAALGRIGDPQDEPLLLKILNEERDHDALLLAASARWARWDPLKPSRRWRTWPAPAAPVCAAPDARPSPPSSRA